MKSFLIAIEGIDGSGKSTLSNNVANLLIKEGCKVTQVRCPGGSPMGRELRDMIKKFHTTCESRALWALFLADIIQTTAEVIKPALNKGHIVLCDRYLLSLMAYHLPSDAGDTLIEECKEEEEILQPNLTVVLDLPVRLAMERTALRDNAPDTSGLCKRVHEKVRAFFRSILKRDGLGLVLNVEELDEELAAEVVLDYIKDFFIRQQRRQHERAEAQKIINENLLA